MLGSVAISVHDFVGVADSDSHKARVSKDGIEVPFKVMAAKGEDRHGSVTVRCDMISVTIDD